MCHKLCGVTGSKVWSEAVDLTGDADAECEVVFHYTSSKGFSQITAAAQKAPRDEADDLSWPSIQGIVHILRDYTPLTTASLATHALIQPRLNRYARPPAHRLTSPLSVAAKSAAAESHGTKAEGESSERSTQPCKPSQHRQGVYERRATNLR